MRGDSILESISFDQERDLSVIVLFKDPPLSTRLDKGAAGERAATIMDALRRVHGQFRSDLGDIEGRLAALGAAPSQPMIPVIRQEYFVAVDGMALNLKPAVIEEVRKLSYVASVSIDEIVTTLDDASNAVIGAPEFWTAYSSKGENIDIAILDTGIDYLHEALGGAPFPNAKVVGGSDIVNHDSDPMDDHGHGSHVAGIAAGDGPSPMQLQGVAPKARLWAFKVLNDAGSGYASEVIAGIEKALDPDGNPSTPSPIEIISMSLGGSGNPGDPMSQAVDNAVKSGIVCAVAAGNRGPTYQTIGSPGCAKEALTVGASTNADLIASFSSRGGTDFTFAIKPDVTAPGSQIVSAKLGGGYVAYNGTSMATPHVAGAAALLRQLHPLWSASEIKAALMESAHDLGKNVWTQGSGRIDLAGAGVISTIVTPGSVSLGMVDSTGVLWSRKDTLTVHNHGSAPQTFDLSLLSPPPGGVSIALAPAAVTVAPEDSASFEVATTVDNTVYGYPSGTPQGFEDRIVIQSTTTPDRVLVPIAFLKAPFMKLKFDRPPLLLFIQNRKGKHILKSGIITDSLTLILPNDTYDVLVDFDFAHTVLRENVSHTGVTALTINSSEASHAITLRTNDLAGSPIAFSNNVYNRYLMPKASKATDLSIGWMFLGYPYQNPYTVSDVSADYVYFSKISGLFPSGSFATIPFAITGGIFADKSLENDAQNWRQVNYQYFAPPGVQTLHVFNETNGWFSQVLTAPFQATSYAAPAPDPSSMPGALQSYLYSHQTISSGSRPFSSTDPVLYRTGLLLPRGQDSVSFYNDGDFGNSLFTTTVNPVDVAIAEGAPLWMGRTWNSGSLISLGPSQTYAQGYFLSHYGDLVFSLFPYTLSRGGSILRMGSLLNGYCVGTAPCVGDPREISTVPPGLYELRATYAKYSIAGVPGLETVTMNFDMGASDKNPPYMRNMSITSDGSLATRLAPGAENVVAFGVSDAHFGSSSGIGSVALSLKLLAAASWQTLALTSQESTYQAQLPEALPAGLYSLRIIARDSANNVLDYKIEPAFVVPGGAEVSDAHFEYGAVSTACLSTKRFSVKNTDATTVLSVSSVACDNPEFAVSPSSAAIPPSSEAFFDIAFQPTSPGAKTGTITIAHSAKAEPDTLTLSGSGITADSGAIAMAVSFGTGWQLISAPLAGCAVSMSPLFEFAASYVQPEVLINGRGYWTKLLEPTIEFRGYPFSEETTHVHKGWNLVGSISEGISATGLQTLPAGIVASPYFGFDGTYQVTDSIIPGHAYWVRTTQSGEIFLRTGPVGPSLKARADEIFSRAHALSLSDGSGRELRLYFIDEQEAETWPERLMLPPTPPGDAFDARFSSGSMLATHGAERGEFSITISATHYPITLRLIAPGDPIKASIVVGENVFELRRDSTVELSTPVSRITLRLHARPAEPSRFALQQNYPNPFNPTTRISYTLPSSAAVRLEVFNTLGERIGSLVDEFQSAGEHSVQFDAANVPSGVYFYRMRAGAFVEVKKMILMR